MCLPKTDPPLFSGSCCLPFVMVMQSVDVRDGYDVPRFGCLDIPALRRVHLQRLVDAVAVVILEIPGKVAPT